MQALSELRRRLVMGCPQMHAARLRVLLVATAALMQHPRLSISALGRCLPGPSKPRHGIKRIDRLVGNRHLMHERLGIYRVLIHWMLQGTAEPVIAVDWSDATPDRRWQLLRAALALKGRTLTLYEEIHPLEQLGNRRVQQGFLKQLQALLPPGCRPILLTDAGFQTPWFRAVEALGWSWVGRLHRKVRVRWPDERRWWRTDLVHALALTRPKTLGEVELTESDPMRAHLVIVRKSRRGRVKRTRYGHIARSKHSQKNAERERQPWLLATSCTLGTRTPKQLVALYSRRMPIEEAFRDVKSSQYGLGFGQTQSHQRERIANLLLLAALALVLLWLNGLATQQQGRAGDYQSNSRRRRSLSIIHLGLYSLLHAPPMNHSQLQQAIMAFKTGGANG